MFDNAEMVHQVVCWICIKGFRSNDCLLRHECNDGTHLELLALQAQGADNDIDGERRTKNRYILASMSGDHQLCFCYCSLGWRVGSCKWCSKLEPQELRTRIFQDIITKLNKLEDSERRADLLAHGLKYYAEHAVEESKREYEKKTYNDLGLLSKLDRFVKYHVKSKLFVDDEVTLRTSPLQTSAIRNRASRNSVAFAGHRLKLPGLKSSLLESKMSKLGSTLMESKNRLSISVGDMKHVDRIRSKIKDSKIRIRSSINSLIAD